MKRFAGILAGVIAVVAVTWVAAPGNAQEHAPARVLRFEPVKCRLYVPKGHRQYEGMTTIFNDAKKTDAGLEVDSYVFRAKVPGGWLVTNDAGAMVLVPDAEHDWDGGALK